MHRPSGPHASEWGAQRTGTLWAQGACRAIAIARHVFDLPCPAARGAFGQMHDFARLA
jgi:hypothetical protein